MRPIPRRRHQRHRLEADYTPVGLEWLALLLHAEAVGNAATAASHGSASHPQQIEQPTARSG